jgi:mannose-6-phosphate isomerase-like protein (cupin superfamily)
VGAIRAADGKVTFSREGLGEARRVEVGPLTVEFGRTEVPFDTTPYFKGLPDDMCQCHHHGYVVQGQLRFKTKDGEIAIQAGEAFDVGPGHIPVFGPGSEWVQFTDTNEQRVTDAAIRRNAPPDATAE